jgi:hypothetical protein
MSLFCVFSIIRGQGVFGVPQHAKKTRLPRFIEMIPYFDYSFCQISGAGGLSIHF